MTNNDVFKLDNNTSDLNFMNKIINKKEETKNRFLDDIDIENEMPNVKSLALEFYISFNRIKNFIINEISDKELAILHDTNHNTLPQEYNEKDYVYFGNINESYKGFINAVANKTVFSNNAYDIYGKKLDKFYSMFIPKEDLKTSVEKIYIKELDTYAHIIDLSTRIEKLIDMYNSKE